ncbi:hypothetical protein [Mesorhizobium sp. M0767]|uniref:hypothetical protein n=1 Tax=Mesorhizobium sp. M0767 TaxID=2956995 RepID=UPI0033396809
MFGSVVVATLGKHTITLPRRAERDGGQDKEQGSRAISWESIFGLVTNTDLAVEVKVHCLWPNGEAFRVQYA